MYTNRLMISELEAKMAAMARQIRRLQDEEDRHPAPFYMCTRCGGLYQSMYGCSCPVKKLTTTKEGDDPK